MRHGGRWCRLCVLAFHSLICIHIGHIRQMFGQKADSRWCWSPMTITMAGGPALVFRKCHLTVLRSLYCTDGEDGGVQDGKSSSNLGSSPSPLDVLGNAFLNEVGVKASDDGGDSKSNGDRKFDDADVSSSDKEDRGDEYDDVKSTETQPPNNDSNTPVSESPVPSEIWTLIHKFLQQRNKYYPLKQRQLHWNQLNTEAQSRLDYLMSISSEIEGRYNLKQQPQTLSKRRRVGMSMTPHTPMFSVTKRSSGGTPGMSLTPLSSNRKSQSQHSFMDDEFDEQIASIPSWNFINGMLQRRARLCTVSCEAFKEQPFLTKLNEECEERCRVLEGVLGRLGGQRGGGQTGGGEDCTGADELRGAVEEGKEASQQSRNSERRKENHTNDDALDSATKRQKLDANIASLSSTTQPQSTTSSGYYFFKDYYSKDENYATLLAATPKNDIDDDMKDYMVETQIKLCLWSSLLTSVKEIVDKEY